MTSSDSDHCTNIQFCGSLKSHRTRVTRLSHEAHLGCANELNGNTQGRTTNRRLFFGYSHMPRGCIATNKQKAGTRRSCVCKDSLRDVVWLGYCSSR
jgi:hypothetical protein